jgi:insulysin
VEELEALTQDDVHDFFTTYFKPGAPARAKTSIHLIAQASADEIAAKTDPAEKLEKLVGQISDTFAQLGLSMDKESLSAQLQKIDVAAGDAQSIMESVGQYLKASAGLAEDQLQQVVQQGQMIMPQLLSAAGIKVPVPEIAANGESDGSSIASSERSKTVRIEDVNAHKAGLGLKPGPRPVKEPTEFEDLEPKL